MTHLNIIESFVTVQGEGPHTGAPATFLRLAGCNLACTWCDTPYSWDWSRYDRATESERADTAELATVLAENHPRLLVITGGEPLLQRTGLAVLLTQLTDPAWRFQFETNGTVSPGLLVHDPRVEFVVSPKLANSGDPAAARLQPAVLREFADLARRGRAWLKVVCAEPADVVAALELAATYDYPLERLWVMAEGITAADHLDTLTRIADTAVAAGVHLGTRLHLLAWPATDRGR